MWLPANWQKTYYCDNVTDKENGMEKLQTLYLVTVTVMSSPFTNTINLMMRMTAFVILSSFSLVFYRGRVARCVWCNIMFVSFWCMSLFCFLSLLDFLLFVFLSVEKKNNNRKQKFYFKQWEWIKILYGWLNEIPLNMWIESFKRNWHRRIWLWTQMDICI